MPDGNKQKFALWIYPDTLKRIEQLYKNHNFKSRSDFIEKAIQFYCGYLSAENALAFLPTSITSAVSGAVELSENRMARLLFKLAVEMSIQQAMSLGSLELQIVRDNEHDHIGDTYNPAPDFFDAPALDSAQDYDDGPELDDDPAYRADWSDWYKLARDFMFGTRTQPPDFDEAHRLLLMEANSGNALAMHDLGRMYADGLGRKADAEAAHDWYAKALAGFIAVENVTRKQYIQYRIGKMFAAGLGTEQDYSQAAEWLDKAAARNYVNEHERQFMCSSTQPRSGSYAQYSLGSLYYSGQGVAQDYIQAFSLYRQSSEQGNAYASYEIAKMLRDGIGCAQDAEMSAQYFKEAFNGFQSMEAERSDDRLQYRLGQMLRDGVGTEPDAARAREYFEASAKLGNPHAQYALAKMIIQAGSDAEQIAEAVSWLSKSADSGNQFAQYSLGKLYLDGIHVDKDIAKAMILLTLSAEQGNEYAQYALGKIYLAGEDVPKDVPAAVRWFTESAEQGNQFSQYQLGKLFLLGRDVERVVECSRRILNRRRR